MIVTNDDNLAEICRMLSNHGQQKKHDHRIIGRNIRLDTIQAAMVLEKLNYLEGGNNTRRRIAHTYQDHLKELVIVPQDDDVYHSVYHTFIIQTDQRQALMEYLLANNVGCKIHYPIPIHLQKAADYLGYKKGDFPVTERQSEQILSLPIFPGLSDEQVERVINVIQEFFKAQK